MNMAFKSQESKAAVLAQYAQMMHSLTIPYERMNVSTRHGETSLIAAGDPKNPPLVLLHGGSMNATMWVSDILDLVKDFRIYAPDMPGEPGLSDEHQLPFDTMDYVDWLFDMLNALGIKKTALCGTSLGGWLASKYAVTYPDQVSALVLICPAGIGSQMEAFKDIAMSLIMQGESGVDELFKQINGGCDIPIEMFNYQKLISACYNARQEPIPAFTDEELSHLTMPGIVFVGGKDIMLRSDETITRIKSLLPHFDITLLPERGHALAGLGKEIKAFLK